MAFLCAGRHRTAGRGQKHGSVHPVLVRGLQDDRTGRYGKTAVERFPNAGEEKVARLVFLSNPDGGMESEVVWINRADQERLKIICH